MALKLLFVQWIFKHIHTLLLKRLNVKIIIGITQDPAHIEDSISRYTGEKHSLTELGPFVSRTEALDWLVFLKSRIGNFEEIHADAVKNDEAVWYGFTFEQRLEK